MALALVKRDTDEALTDTAQTHENLRKRGGAEAILSMFSNLSVGNEGRESSGSAAQPATTGATGEKPDTTEVAGAGQIASMPIEDWELNQDPGVSKRKLWQGLDGIAVMSFGVLLPLIMLFFGIASCPKRLTLVMINHPLESCAELIMLAVVPAINFLVWSTICKDSIRLTGRHGLLLGIAAGTALTIALTCLAGVIVGSKELESQIGTGFNTGFCFLSALSLCTAAVSAYLVKRVGKAWDLPRFQTQVKTYSVVGALFAIFIFAAMEALPWGVRISEKMALSNSPDERRQGLGWLRAINPEQQLRLECSDSRAAGLVGLFIPIKSSSQHELYFAVTGKPYSYRDIKNNDLTSMPDEYLSKNVVGEKIKELSLTRSSMTGTVHARTLTSTIDWTLVFKNDSTSPQEARGEIKVPQGGVVTGLTLWQKGEPHSASFAASGKVDGVSSWVQANHTSPAMLTDLGRGRILLHCYPVSLDEQLKVRVSFVVPLKAEGAVNASVVLPKFIATNFGIGGENLLKLRSDTQLSSGLANLKQEAANSGERTISGTFADRQLEGSDLTIFASRPQALSRIAVMDYHAMDLKHEEDERNEENEKLIEKEENPAQQVMVMIDGSKGLPHQLETIKNALKKKKSAVKEEPKPVKPVFLVEDIARRAAAVPKHLVVVLDGSCSIKKYVGELRKSLAKMPGNVQASLIVASQEQEKLTVPTPLSEGLKGLGTVSFVGGQDNLKSLVKAAEIAGESRDGAVLWIHGPQPLLNSEVYIVSPYTSVPHFYELPLDAGETDTCEFLKNHSEIGPFTQVPRTDSVAADVQQFISKWTPGQEEYVAAFGHFEKLPASVSLISGDEVRELTALNANQQCHELIKNRNPHQAAVIALAYEIVTPVSSAMIGGGNESTSEINGNQNYDASSTRGAAPRLQGATNGTIGAQMDDGTYVTGVNTAGTVRVNNLANLEALLNIIANLCEVALVLSGGIVLLQGVFVRTTVTNLLGMPVSLTPAKRIAIGVILIVVGLFIPGLINWFVASARDANLFS
jgi:hypothetical protein